MYVFLSKITNGTVGISELRDRATELGHKLIWCCRLIQCVAEWRRGFRRGNYVCQCADGFFMPSSRSDRHFDGRHVELQYSLMVAGQPNQVSQMVDTACGRPLCQNSGLAAARNSWDLYVGTRPLLYYVTNTLVFLHSRTARY